MRPKERILERRSAAPAQSKGKFDGDFDIIVVGGGGGGLPAALFSRWRGNTVLLLEKAHQLGGTAKKAAFWYWVPNNAPMRAMGIADPKADCVRYMARLARPNQYDPNHPQLGLTEWEISTYEAIYDSSPPAAELLKKKGALPYRHCAAVPDYWAELPENKAPLGRVLLPLEASASMSDGGQVAVRSMVAAAERDGIDIRTGHRVQRVIRNGKNEVIGVEADSARKRTLRFRARKAVIFATGGFSHNPELRRNFLNAPVYGGCAAMSNEGDFVYIASVLGAQLRNMNYAWMCPVSLEKSLASDPAMSGMFSVAGDSMIFVDKNGRRVVNEKLAYNELAQTFFHWDATKSEYPQLVLISVWDQRSQDHSASLEYGRLIVPPKAGDGHVIRGMSWEELAKNIAIRLEKYAAATGSLRLSTDFVTNIRSTVERFNQFATNGEDLDFHRGERKVELLFNGIVCNQPAGKNPTMYPIGGVGPYYAALVTGGTLDTKGGPKATPNGQVLDAENRPISGLYGVGNCVASASGRAYWAGGSTLGPIIGLAYRAARTADREIVKK